MCVYMYESVGEYYNKRIHVCKYVATVYICVYTLRGEGFLDFTHNTDIHVHTEYMSIHYVS